MSARWQRLRGLFAYHGVWALGVGLMRNLDLRGKAIAVAVGVAIPITLIGVHLVRTTQAEVAASERESDGVRQYEALLQMQRVSRELSRLLHDEDVNGGPSRSGLAARNELQAFNALGAALARTRTSNPRLGQAWNHTAQAHEQLHKVIADRTPAAAPGLPTPRFTAYARFLVALDVVVVEALQGLGVRGSDDAVLAALQEATMRWMPTVDRSIMRTTMSGDLLYVREGRAVRARGLHEHAVEARFVLGIAGAQFEQVAAQAGLEPSLLQKRLALIRTHFDQAIKLGGRAGNSVSEEATTVLAGFDRAEYARTAAAALQAADALETDMAAVMKRGVDLRDREQAAKRYTHIAMLSACTLLTIYLLVCAYKVIAGGLSVLCHNVDELGRGNLGIRPRGLGRDEIGRALTTLGASAANMASLFEAVTQGVAAVSHASREVAQGNAGLSGRTGDIRSAIGDVAQRAQTFASAMDGCGREVEQVAEHVRGIRAEAQRSRKAMGSLRQRMRALQTKSREISKVVELVEVVSYQTRLLSLNASVEAARAGAGGKGFAVVAQEVRQLAKRSQLAARQINTIVSSSIAEIEDGSLMTERAVEAVRCTDEKIEAVNGLMADIVRLTHESHNESQAVLRITRSVEDAAGGNAKLVDQLSLASADLRDHGDSLKRSVQHFVFS